MLVIMGNSGRLLAAVSDPVSGPVSPTPSVSSDPSAEPSASASASPTLEPSPSASATSSPSVSPSPSSSASASPSASVSPSPSPSPSGQVIVFDDFGGQNTPLNGQFPQGTVDWGQNVWFVASPVGEFETKSVRFNDNWGRSETFSFMTPKTLKSVEVFNNNRFPAFVYASCRSFGWPFFNFAYQMVEPLESETLNTGWSAKCATVKVFSSRGEDTYFDNFLIQ